MGGNTLSIPIGKSFDVFDTKQRISPFMQEGDCQLLVAAALLQLDLTVNDALRNGWNEVVWEIFKGDS